MNKIDSDGLLMCKIQGNIFEKSFELCSSSSSVFIKRYMNSYPADSMDRDTFLFGTMSDYQVIDYINEEYPKPYGKEKFSKEELYWIGFTYRYWSYVYKQRSKDIIKTCSPSEMRKLYYPYHSLDTLSAIDRILEARNIKYENDLFKLTEEIINRKLNFNN